MSNSEEGSFLMGFALAVILTMLVAFAMWPIPKYERCAEDEVWAWQAGYRATYGESEWECVALDDLIGEAK